MARDGAIARSGRVAATAASDARVTRRLPTRPASQPASGSVSDRADRPGEQHQAELRLAGVQLLLERRDPRDEAAVRGSAREEDDGDGCAGGARHRRDSATRWAQGFGSTRRTALSWRPGRRSGHCGRAHPRACASARRSASAPAQRTSIRSSSGSRSPTSGLFLATLLYLGWEGGLAGEKIEQALRDVVGGAAYVAAGRAGRDRRADALPQRARRRESVPHRARGRERRADDHARLRARRLRRRGPRGRARQAARRHRLVPRGRHRPRSRERCF